MLCRPSRGGTGEAEIDEADGRALPPDRQPSYNQRDVPGHPDSPETLMTNPPPLDVLEQATEWKAHGFGVALATGGSEVGLRSTTGQSVFQQRGQRQV